MKYKFLIIMILATSACAEPFTTYEKPKLEYGQCPQPFWVPDYVAAEFRKYPNGHPMNEFFRAYVKQQKALEDYYSKNRFGNNPQKQGF